MAKNGRKNKPLTPYPRGVKIWASSVAPHGDLSPLYSPFSAPPEDYFSHKFWSEKSNQPHQFGVEWREPVSIDKIQIRFVEDAFPRQFHLSVKRSGRLCRLPVDSHDASQNSCSFVPGKAPIRGLFCHQEAHGGGPAHPDQMGIEAVSVTPAEDLPFQLSLIDSAGIDHPVPAPIFCDNVPNTALKLNGFKAVRLTSPSPRPLYGLSVVIERLGSWGDLEELVEGCLESGFHIECSCCSAQPALQPEIFLDLKERGVVSGKSALFFIFPTVAEHSQCTVHLSNGARSPLLLSDIQWLSTPPEVDKMLPVSQFKASYDTTPDELTLGAVQPLVTLMPEGSLSFENALDRSTPSQQLLMRIAAGDSNILARNRNGWKKRDGGKLQTYEYPVGNKGGHYSLTVEKTPYPDAQNRALTSVEIHPGEPLEGQLLLALSLKSGCRRLPLILRTDYREDRLYLRWPDGKIALEMDPGWIAPDVHQSTREILFSRAISPGDRASLPFLIKIQARHNLVF